MQDQLLMLLMYYRAYRTFLHTATAYGYSESQGWRIVRRLEDILINSGVFRLAGKRPCSPPAGKGPCWWT